MGAPVEPATRRALRAALVLAIAAAIAVGMVALVHDEARPAIEANRRAAQLRQFAAILGATEYDNDPLVDTLSVTDPELLGTEAPVTVYRVRRAGQAVAVVVPVVAPQGYSGPLRLLVAIDAGGRLLGVRVIEHRETPGLGDLVEERRSGWILGFAGRGLADPPPARWKVRKDGGDFDQFTGATVTPRAVVAAVRDALHYFERERERLLAPPPAVTP
jgi:electron transport complex protein RnfG